MQGDSWVQTYNVINCIINGNVSWGTQLIPLVFYHLRFA